MAPEGQTAKADFIPVDAAPEHNFTISRQSP